MNYIAPTFKSIRNYRNYALTGSGDNFLSSFFANTAGLLSGLVIKLIAAPLMVLLFCRLFGLTGLAVQVSIMEAGMPPMVIASAMAVIAGMETELAVALATVGIIFSFGTLPLLYWLI